MTALAGWVDPSPIAELERNCRTMMSGLRIYSTKPVKLESAPGAAFAGACSGIVPDDRPGQSPLAADDNFLIAADARIDNRQELLSALGIEPAAGRRLSDPQLILAGWSRWHDGLIERMAGDFAIAVFEWENRRLILARDPSGQRPLFLAQLDGRLAFASMPAGLTVHPALNCGWNERGFASALGDELATEATYFHGVSRLMPGHKAIFEAGELSIEQWWSPSFEPLRMSDDDFVDAYQSLLDQAVRARSIGQSGIIASQLSSGWDSSAVTTSAALCASLPVVAYTSAPAAGFKGPVPRGRLADESFLAARTAALHGLEHHVLRSSPLTLEYLQQQALAYQEPARNLINGVWDRDIHVMARDRGARVLLNGLLGNLTLNFGGLPVLPQWLAAGQIGEWWRQAYAASLRNDVRWRGILFNSFQHWLWLPAWRAARRAGLGIDRYTGWFLHPQLRELAEQAPLDRPTGNQALDRMRLIIRLDHGILGKGAIADSGIETADPLADRRLIEFSLRLPPDQLLRCGSYKPLARRALEGRVPADVLDSPLRGIQAADWPIRFTQSEANRIFEEIESNQTAGEILDLKRIRGAIDAWPTSDRDILDRWELYSRMLPIALATGVFVQSFQPIPRSASSPSP